MPESQLLHLTRLLCVTERITVTITDDQHATLLREADEAGVTPSAVIQAALDALGDAPSSGAEIRARIERTNWGGHREGAGRRAMIGADEPGGP